MTAKTLWTLRVLVGVTPFVAMVTILTLMFAKH